VYSEAIHQLKGEAEPGALVDVVDDQGRLIGRGLYSPRSQIRVRMVTRGDVPAHGFVRARLEQALALRKRLDLPSAEPGLETDCFRLINSEGDGLPGLTVDVYGDAVAIQFSTIGMKVREAEVVEGIQALLASRTVYEVPAGGYANVEGFSSAPRVIAGESRARVPCVERGIRLEVEPLAGQKTGYFLDQRDNRALVARYARGARVLDCYSYGGGFALAALRAGAKHATCVDVSGRALAHARENAERNHLELPTLVEEDVFRYLETAPPRGFDLVIVDPPKFARARKDLEAAYKGYRRLNALALNACTDGALLATCSCSQLVSQEDLERALAGAAQDAGRRLQVLAVASQGVDHPVPPAFPEGRYLKLILLRVE
jgi:23S rRNA (cytosine1962-C5)-methyltransferase